MATTSQEEEELYRKYIDMKTKMKIAANIVNSCKVEAQAQKMLGSLYLAHFRTKVYTQEDDNVISKASIRDIKSLVDYDYERGYREKREICQVYDKYRDVIIDSFLNKREFPTLETTFYVYKEIMKIPKIFKNNVGLLTSVLNNMGFTVTKIPNTQNFFVMEHPENLRIKIKYLTELAQYRSENRNIIYVEERAIDGNEIVNNYDLQKRLHSKFSVYLITAFSKRGVLHLSLHKNVMEHYEKVIASLLKQADEPSVIILGTRSHHKLNERQVPSQYSSKAEMCSFLSDNDIPYTYSMSKAELYQLIARCKHNVPEKYYIHEVAKSFGHVILSQPPISKRLVIKTSMNDIELENITIRPRPLVANVVLTSLQKMKQTDWRKSETELIEREQKMLDEDLKIEEIIDRLMTLTRDERVAKKELDYPLPAIADPFYLDDIMIYE